MRWPDRPTIHRDCKDDEQFWGEPSLIMPYRTCSICGSLHPQDLIRVLRNGAVLVKDLSSRLYYVEGENYLYWSMDHLLDEGYDASAIKLLEEEIKRHENSL